MENQSSLEERLVAEMGWLQSLARSLVRDPGVADDIVQDVLLGGLESQGGSRGPQLRQDLFGRLKTRAFNKRREAARRRLREESYARADQPEAQANDVALIVGEADTAELLMREVMALAEGHRAILLLCYFEGRSQREIAASLGIKHDAVRTRLTRARAALRERLDRSSSRGREGWLPAVFALAERSPVAPASLWTPVWTLVLGWSAVKIVLVVAVAVLIGWLSVAGRFSATPLVPSVELAGRDALPLVPGAPGVDRLKAEEVVGRRAALPEQKPQTRAAASGLESLLPDALDWSIAGRVVEEVGGGPNVPLEGALVRVLSFVALDGLARDADYPVITARTDADGRFKVAMPIYYSGALEITSPGKIRALSKLEGYWPATDPIAEEWLHEELEEDICLVEGRMIVGRLQGPSREPIPGATIHAYWPGGYAIDSFDDGPLGPHLAALGVTDPDGRFALRHRSGPDGGLVFQHQGYVAKIVEPASGEEPLVVTLAKGASISGQLLWPTGAGRSSRGTRLDREPLVVAAVPFGETMDGMGSIEFFARPADDGRFVIGGLVPGQSYDLRVLSGALPLRSSEPRSLKVTATAGATGLEIEVRKGVTVVFRVVDEAGQAVSGNDSAELSIDAFFSADGLEEAQYFGEGLYRTPLFTEEWQGGNVELTRLVPSELSEKLCICVDASDKALKWGWYGPFEDGERVDLGTITVAPAAESAPQPSVLVGVVDIAGRSLPGVGVESWLAHIEAGPNQAAIREMSTQELSRFRSFRKSTTDADGLALHDRLVDGVYFFRAALPFGWYGETLHDTTGDKPRGTGTGWARLFVSGAETSASQLTIEQPPSGPVHGTVSRPGRSVAGAALSFASAYDPRSIRSAREAARRAARSQVGRDAMLLDDTGTFESDVVPVGDWLAVVAFPQEADTFETVVSTRLAGSELSIVLEHALAHGVVVDPDGRPLEGALVDLWPREGSIIKALSDTSTEMELHGLGSVKHPRLRSEGGVLTAADGSYALPVPTWTPDWALLVQHDEYSSEVVQGGTRALGGQIAMPRCELGPAGEVQLLSAGRTDIWYVRVDRIEESGAPGPDDWANYHYGNREGYTFYRVPTGRVRVYAFVDRGLAVDVGEAVIRRGERTVIEIDPEAVAVPVTRKD